MRRCLPVILIATAMASPAVAAAQTQHNRLAISPPTAPPPMGFRGAGTGEPVAPVSSGLGPLQFTSVNYGVPAPQSITRQLQSDDERTRSGSLSVLGVPSMYLNRGHIPYPHSIQLQFAQLGNNDDVHALLTVELDNHLVAAILAQDEGGNWRRIGTVTCPNNFAEANGGPSSFLRLSRSLLQPNKYRAVFHGTATYGNGDSIENEAHLRVLNGKAVITLSFVSSSRQCAGAGMGPMHGNPHGGCDLLQRWLEPDPVDPSHRFNMVSATGHLGPREVADPLTRTAPFRTAHLRNFNCQPFAYSDQTQHFEPVANSGPCPTMREPAH